MTNTRRLGQMRASFVVGLLVLASSAASCSSTPTALERAEHIAGATGKLRFQVENADGVAVANQNLLIVLQALPGELNDAANLPERVGVSWIGDFWSVTAPAESGSAPNFDLCLTAPGRAAWIPTRVLEVESGELGQVEIDVGPQLVGRRLTLGVSAAFEKWPIHWIGAVESNASGTDVEVAHLELLDRLQRPPEVTELDDARLALETELELWTLLRARSAVSLSYLRLLEESGRRGGPRWREFLAEREEELVRNLEDPPQSTVWLALQSALRRSRGEGPPLRVVVHPEDRGTESHDPKLPIRFELRNVDPVHSYDLIFTRSGALASVQDPAGRDAPRKSFPNFPHVGLAQHARVAPGETTTTHDAEGWWTVNVADEFDLGEGDWTLRLVYLPFGAGQFSSFASGSTTFTSEPFVVRVRKGK